MRDVGRLARFRNYEAEPDHTVSLAVDHPAVVEGRTLFPGTVAGTFQSRRFFVSAANSAKIGKQIEKGPWKGFPVFTLTLEERATCPRTCHMWEGCLVPGSRVLTADLRWVPIETLSAGDRLAGFDEEMQGQKHRKTRIATVEAIGREVKPCYRITTDRGSMVCSSDHLHLRRRTRLAYKWWATEDLRPGDKLQFFGEPWEEDRSYEAGRLRGFVEGEGCCGAYDSEGFAKSRIGWYQRPSKLCDEIVEIATKLGFKTRSYDRIGGVNGTAVTHVDVLGGWRAVAAFLGRIRPTRMIEKAEDIWSDHDLGGRGGNFATIQSIEKLGDLEVVPIRTSTGTLVAEGFYTHNCFGNAMQWARRNDAFDPDFIPALKAEMITLVRETCAPLRNKPAFAPPKGIVVRLHVLGDFYSAEYVQAWAGLMNKLPELHVFGYTARRLGEGDRIAENIQLLNEKYPDRWAIRFSSTEPGAGRTIVVDEDPRLDDVIMCPASTHASECCSTCALCWSPNAWDKTIAFKRHGIKRGGGRTFPRKDGLGAERALHDTLKTLCDPQGIVIGWALLALAEEAELSGGATGRAMRNLIADRKVELLRPGIRAKSAVYRVFDEAQEEFPPAPPLPAPAKRAAAPARPQMDRPAKADAKPVRERKPDEPLMVARPHAHRKGGWGQLQTGSADQFDIGTPEERIAALPPSEAERIAAQYGVIVKKETP